MILTPPQVNVARAIGILLVIFSGHMSNNQDVTEFFINIIIIIIIIIIIFILFFFFY